jgi:hypothetical protein
MFLRISKHDSGARPQTSVCSSNNVQRETTGAQWWHRGIIFKQPKIHSKDAEDISHQRSTGGSLRQYTVYKRDQHASRNKQRLPHDGESCILVASTLCLWYLRKFIWSSVCHGPRLAPSWLRSWSELSAFDWHFRYENSGIPYSNGVDRYHRRHFYFLPWFDHNYRQLTSLWTVPLLYT